MSDNKPLEAPENPGKKGAGLTRRQLLGHAGKAVYVAPVLTLLTSIPEMARAQGIPNCSDVPDPGGIGCDSGSTSTTTSERPKKRRRKD